MLRPLSISARGRTKHDTLIRLRFMKKQYMNEQAMLLACISSEIPQDKAGPSGTSYMDS